MKTERFDASVRQFWEWFVSNQEPIIQSYRSGDKDWLDQHLSTRVIRTFQGVCSRPVTWEIGPGQNAEYQLVLSPGVAENVPSTHHMISLAPQIPGWEWHSCKPPKLLRGLRFEITSSIGERETFDASSWKYAIRLPERGGKFSILFLAPDTIPADQQARDRLARIVFESLVGEDLVLNSFDRINLLPNTEAIPASKVTPIGDLRQHLNHLGLPVPSLRNRQD